MESCLGPRSVTLSTKFLPITGLGSNGFMDSIGASIVKARDSQPVNSWQPWVRVPLMIKFFFR